MELELARKMKELEKKQIDEKLRNEGKEMRELMRKFNALQKRVIYLFI
jgi:hypothetical protein